MQLYERIYYPVEVGFHSLQRQGSRGTFSPLATASKPGTSCGNWRPAGHELPWIKWISQTFTTGHDKQFKQSSVSMNCTLQRILQHFTSKNQWTLYNKTYIYIYIHVGSCRQTLVPNIQCVVQIQTPALCWSDREWLRVHGEESKIGNEWMKSYQRKKTNAMLFGAQIDCLVGGFSPFEKY